MKFLPVVFLLLLQDQALAADAAFDARVKRADEVEASPAGTAYQKTMMQALGSDLAAVMRDCVTTKVTGPDASFTLVADLLPDQTLVNVVVQPSTPMTRCVASRLVDLPFPKAPASFGAEGMPLVMKMRIMD